MSLPVVISFVGPVDNTSANFVFCLGPEPQFTGPDLASPLLNKQGSH